MALPVGPRIQQNLLLRSLPGQAKEPGKREALYSLVNDDLGYRLHESVQNTKRLLMSRPEADFHFRDDAVNQLFPQTKITAAHIDRAFFTDGRSFVPTVRELFTTRFGPCKIQSRDEFTSIAEGLA